MALEFNTVKKTFNNLYICGAKNSLPYIYTQNESLLDCHYVYHYVFYALEAIY